MGDTIHHEINTAQSDTNTMTSIKMSDSLRMMILKALQSSTRAATGIQVRATQGKAESSPKQTLIQC